eukprot:1158031-Pelagomonas_calceolata.AAC.1
MPTLWTSCRPGCLCLNANVNAVDQQPAWLIVRQKPLLCACFLPPPPSLDFARISTITTYYLDANPINSGAVFGIFTAITHFVIKIIEL